MGKDAPVVSLDVSTAAFFIQIGPTSSPAALFVLYVATTLHIDGTNDKYKRFQECVTAGDVNHAATCCWLQSMPPIQPNPALSSCLLRSGAAGCSQLPDGIRAAAEQLCVGSGGCPLNRSPYKPQAAEMLLNGMKPLIEP